ncbi:hypothetical protein [Mesorhizobium sp. YR577]|uniref:hypothetical protein n=1 Tax=Mesorhizobium sp. YR577 TaxID=1884373 RepID=UPI001587676C|nr:hypothetical protein [Mesorhizobium sp. YR577]
MSTKLAEQQNLRRRRCRPKAEDYFSFDLQVGRKEIASVEWPRECIPSEFRA